MAFRLFGFEVEVRLGFWLTALLLGSQGNFDTESLKRVLLWTPILFVSILVHELGHAFAIKWQKLQPSIVLHFMGGLTSWREVLPVSRRARIVISLAGPFAGFLLGGLVFATVLVLAATGVHIPPESPIRDALGMALWINIIWGAVNLMPVLPFDGGHVLEQALGPRRQRITLGISAAVGIALCIFFLAREHSLWGAYLFGSAAASSVIQLRGLGAATRVTAPPPELVTPASLLLARAKTALDADDAVAAVLAAQEVLDAKPSETVRADAWTIVAWAELMRGDTSAAERAVSEIRRYKEPDRALMGNVSLAAGRLSEARNILERAYGDGDLRKETFGPLIQALLRQDAHERAAEVALERFDSLSSDDCRQIAKLAIEGRAFGPAAKLLERVGVRDRSGSDAIAAARAYADGGERTKAVDALRKAFVSGLVKESDVRSDDALGALLGEAPAVHGTPS